MEALLKLLIMFGIGAIGGTVVGLSLVLASKIYGRKDSRQKTETSASAYVKDDNAKENENAVKKGESVPDSSTVGVSMEKENQKSEFIVKRKDKNFKGYLKRGLMNMLEDGKPKVGKKPSGFLLLGNSIKHLIKSKTT